MAVDDYLAQTRQKRFNALMGQGPAVAPPSGLPSGGGIPDGGRTAGGAQRAPGAARGTGFINPQTYLDANRGAGAAMAGRVAGETARQGDAVRAALGNLQAGQMAGVGLEGQAQDAAARARLAGPQGGGLSTVLAQDYGQTGPYTSGMGGFDAFLAGAAGGKQLQASANQYGMLGKEVQAFNEKAAAYTPPAAAPVPPALAATPSVAGKSSRPRAPAPYSPLTYTPEQVEGRPNPNRKKMPGVPQQMDPNSWLGKPWGGM